MAARIHTLDFTLRGVPADLPEIELKQYEVHHGLRLVTSLFRVIGLMSFEQSNLHLEFEDRYQKGVRIDELNDAMNVVAELGASIGDATFNKAEELVALIPEKN